jgi:uncharacterized protein
MKWLTKKNIRKWLRIIHRDLGYFLVGTTIVYSISGIILNHKKTGEDPAYKTEVIKEELTKSMTISQFTKTFEERFQHYKLNRLIPEDKGYQLFIKGGIGFYNTISGELWFEIYKKKPIVFFFNKLHYNQKKFWTTPADIFAVSLIFLAISGLIMVRGKKGFIGRGIWFTLGGILFVIIFIWL